MIGCNFRRTGVVRKRRTEKYFFEKPAETIGVDACPGVFIEDHFITVETLANTGFSFLIFTKFKFGHDFLVSTLNIQLRANFGNGHTRRSFSFTSAAAVGGYAREAERSRYDGRAARRITRDGVQPGVCPMIIF